ncbi:MAG: hypothetical protein HY321_05995 [Armatimonadetes bacterium]|nr:hypothetical protein [Armatimonadota bacterium]
MGVWERDEMAAHREDGCERRRRVLIALGAAGLVAFAVALAVDPRRAWTSLLLGNLFFLLPALGGTVLVALNYAFSGAWLVAFRRVPEAMSAYLPIAFALMVILFAAGGRALYPWLDPERVAGSPHLQHKAVYLNAPFFLARTAIAFGVWMLFSRLLRRHSRAQDHDGDVAHTRRSQRLSAGFLVAFAATFIFASFDWVMSLQPEWYSTLFPAYLLAGLLLGGSVVTLAMVILLRREGHLPVVGDGHLYELVRLTAAASTFWAYIWFCQYMLIYYTNIPEEAVYYASWREGAWAWLFPLNLVLNWVAPVALLLPSRGRRSGSWLLKVCAVVLVGRWLDLYLLVAPAPGLPMRLGLPEILIPLGLAPLFVLPARRLFFSARPVPERDPYLRESAPTTA